MSDFQHNNEDDNQNCVEEAIDGRRYRSWEFNPVAFARKLVEGEDIDDQLRMQEIAAEADAFFNWMTVMYTSWDKKNPPRTEYKSNLTFIPTDPKTVNSKESGAGW